MFNIIAFSPLFIPKFTAIEILFHHYTFSAQTHIITELVVANSKGHFYILISVRSCVVFVSVTNVLYTFYYFSIIQIYLSFLLFILSFKSRILLYLLFNVDILQESILVPLIFLFFTLLISNLTFTHGLKK